MPEDENAQHDGGARDESDEMARLQEQINNLPVSEHLLYMMQSLASLAVDRLGLVPDRSDRRDVEQARLAIDGFKALLGVLEPVTSAEEIAAQRNVLAQLQLAYVGALGSAPAAGTEPSPGPGAAPAEEAASEDAPEPELKAEPAPKKAAKAGASGKDAKSAGAAKSAPKSGAKSSGSAKGGKQGS